MNITYATTVWNTTRYLGLISNVDAASAGLLITLLLVGVFLITFFLMKSFDTLTSVLSAAFTTAAFGLLLAYAGVSSVDLVAPSFIVLIIAVILFMLN